MMHRVTLMTWLALVSVGCPRSTPGPAHESSTTNDVSPRRRSTPAHALADVIQIAADGDQSCALRSNGQVYCWGQLAGLDRSQPRPRQVNGIIHAREITVRYSRAFAVERSGDVVAWGGLTGPHYRHRRVPVRHGEPYRVGGNIVADWEIERTEPLDPALSAEAAAAAHPHEVQLADERPRFGPPADPQWRTTARAVPTRLRTDGTIFVADGMLCTHARDGALSCVKPHFLDAFPSWNESQTKPEPDLVDMAANAMPEVCLLRRDGSIECVRYPEGDVETWGDREFRTDRVPLPAPATAIASGACAAVLLRDGRVATWCETNDEGHIQPDVTVHPHIDDAVAIDMGGGHLCVLRRSDDVTCWYVADYPHFHMPKPRTITTLDHPTQIAVGDRHACALVAEGRVQCWGGNEHGQLGNGSLDDADLDEDGSAPSLIPDTPPTWVVAPEPANTSTPSP